MQDPTMTLLIRLYLEWQKRKKAAPKQSAEKKR